MSDNLSKTIAQYKTLEQLQEFASAQEQVITQLSKKIQNLEKEKHAAPAIKTINAGVETVAVDDAEFICIIEISKLKEASMERELTFEEAKRLEIYYKTLTQINAKKPNDEREAEKLPTDKLLQLVETKKDAAE